MNELALTQQQITDQVEMKINSITEAGQLHLPSGYVAGNALKSAFLEITSAGLMDKCTKDSVANTLFDMVVQGLNISKKQCYFIPYGKTLKLSRSYHGEKLLAKRVSGGRIDDVIARCIYEKDELDYDIVNGRIEIKKHSQSFGNINNDKITGAYAIAVDVNGEPVYTELMTFEEIKQSWKQSAMNPIDNAGNVKAGSVHGKFTQEMAKKTVIRRACKGFIGASTDDALLLDSFNRTTENDYLKPKIVAPEEMYETVKEESNEVVNVSIEDTEIIEVPDSSSDEPTVQKGF